MKITLRFDRSQTKTVIILALLTVLLLSLSAYLGELAVPFAAASFALLLSFDKGKRIATVICTLVGISLLLLPLQLLPIWSAVSLILGALLCLSYKFGFSKCDSAILLTVVASAGMLLFFFIIAFEAIGVWDFGAAMEFYSELKEMLKSEFVNGIMGVYSTIPEAVEMGITSEYVAALFDSFANMIVSVIAVISFFLVGVMMKTFCFIGRRLAEENDGIYTWRFETPSVYAYFYVAIYVLSMFIAPDSVIGITIANVVGILSFLFAYMGMKYVYGFFAERQKKVLGRLVIIASVLIFSSLALDLLSVFGAAYTVYRHGNNTDSGTTNTQN